MDAGQQLDQGRFAGAVLADDGVNFAFLECQVDAFQRVRGAEPLVEFFQNENWSRAPGSRRWRYLLSWPAQAGIAIRRLIITPACALCKRVAGSGRDRRAAIDPQNGRDFYENGGARNPRAARLRNSLT